MLFSGKISPEFPLCNWRWPRFQAYHFLLKSKSTIFSFNNNNIQTIKLVKIVINRKNTWTCGSRKICSNFPIFVVDLFINKLGFLRILFLKKVHFYNFLSKIYKNNSLLKLFVTQVSIHLCVHKNQPCLGKIRYRKYDFTWHLVLWKYHL